LVAIWLIAQDARADETQARELFGAGVKAMLASDWTEAVRLLEASLAQQEKAACRYNLIVANRELQRPLEVARHAVAFLGRVEGSSHSGEAAEVRTFLNEAVRELVTLQAEGLPLGTQLKVDDAPPTVMDGSRVYVLPGLHRLELWLGARQLESIEIELGAGAVQPWPRVRALHDPAAAEITVPVAQRDPASGAPPTAAPVSTPPPVGPRLEASQLEQARTKRLWAWSLGLAGAATGASAAILYGSAARKADEVRSDDPMEFGYSTGTDRYQRLQLSVMPLAFAGGALMASGTALVAQRPRAALVISITMLVLGVAAASAGTVLMVRTPETLIEGTGIKEPSREAGSLALGAALPLLTYGTHLQWQVWRHTDAHAR
jgi:hypothetical protein